MFENKKLPHILLDAGIELTIRKLLWLVIRQLYFYGGGEKQFV